MKRTIALAAAILLAFLLLTACGGTNGSGESKNDQLDTPPSSLDPGKVYYTVTDYYNDDGTFSELGLALNEINSEKTLALSDGDIFIVNGRQYMVTADSLTLSFYTQSSLADVIQWWTDYVKIWSEDGIISEVE